MKSKFHEFGTAKDELLIIPVCYAWFSDDGQLMLMKRFLDGVAHYAQHWQGSVSVLVRISEHKPTGLDPIPFFAENYPFVVEPIPGEFERLRARLAGARIILGTLAEQNFVVGQLAESLQAPMVWITETTLRTRAQIIDADIANPVRRIKRKIVNELNERKCRSFLSSSVGVQCNGTPTYREYCTLNRNPILFFDSRVTQTLLADDNDINAKAKRLHAGNVLRLVFSGRLTEIKGVQHLPRVAFELRKQGVPFTLDIYGDGNLKNTLAKEINTLGLDDYVHLCGVLDLHTQLMPTFRHDADMFLCCHPQGDPSCTYLETLACGVPIVGYANEAWQGMHNLSDAGWLVEMGNSKQMMNVIADIHSHRECWLPAAKAALKFAKLHTFERTIQQRVEHLYQCLSQDNQLQGPGIGVSHG